MLHQLVNVACLCPGDSDVPEYNIVSSLGTIVPDTLVVPLHSLHVEGNLGKYDIQFLTVLSVV